MEFVGSLQALSSSDDGVRGFASSVLLWLLFQPLPSSNNGMNAQSSEVGRREKIWGIEEVEKNQKFWAREDVFSVHLKNSFNSLILNWCISGYWFIQVEFP